MGAAPPYYHCSYRDRSTSPQTTVFWHSGCPAASRSLHSASHRRSRREGERERRRRRRHGTPPSHTPSGSSRTRRGWTCPSKHSGSGRGAAERPVVAAAEGGCRDGFPCGLLGEQVLWTRRKPRFLGILFFRTRTETVLFFAFPLAETCLLLHAPALWDTGQVVHAAPRTTRVQTTLWNPQNPRPAHRLAPPRHPHPCEP